jgi:hypothetical protein
MKNKLKLVFFLTLILSVFTLSAQTYRLELGYNNPDRYGVNVSSTYFNGIKLGGTAEFDLKNNLSLLTGALYNIVYSYKVQGYPGTQVVNYETLGHSVDIPIRLTYTYPFSKTISAFAFAGPNINIGLAQNMKITSTQTYQSDNPYYIKPGPFDLYNGSDYQLNRLNLQIGIGAGVQWKKYQLKGGYDFGINNLDKSVTGNLYQKGWYVSVAYQF